MIFNKKAIAFAAFFVLILNNIYSQCSAPTMLAATAPTTLGATLNWTENAGSTSWDIEIQPVGNAATGVPTIASTTSKPYLWTGGTQASGYNFWVRSICPSTGVSAWAGPFLFYTALDNASPVCLNFALPNLTCSNTIPISVAAAGGTTLGTDIFLDRVEVTMDCFHTQDYDLFLHAPNGQTVELSTDNGGTGQDFGNSNTCPFSPAIFGMWASTSITTATPPFIGNFLPEGNFSSLDGANPNGNWTLEICDDNGPTTGDLIFMKLVFTDCRRPSGVSATSLTSSGATIDWVENGTATEWDLEIQPVGTSATGVPTIAGATSKPFVWTGGVQATNYRVWVRSNCGGTQSAWSIASSNFQTKIDNVSPVCLNVSIPTVGCTNTMPIEVLGAGGTELGTDVFLDRVEIILDHNTTSEITVNLIGPNGQSVELTSGNGGTGDDYGQPSSCPNLTTTFAMWAATSITAGTAPFFGTFLPEGNFSTFNGANPNGDWTINVCDVSGAAPPAGIFKYVKLHFLTCARPSAIVTSAPTTTGATIDWTEIGNSMSWDLEIQPLGTPALGIPTFAGVTTKPFNWTGGAQATGYQVWVRSNCGGGSVSPWSAGTVFSTVQDNASPVCFNFALPSTGCSNTVPISVSGAVGNTLGTDVFLDRIELTVAHTRLDELDIFLKSPNNQTVELTTDNGGTGDNYGNPAVCPAQPTVFAMWAATAVTAGAAPFIGNYLPEGNFSSLNGADPNGNWTLEICDDNGSTSGSLRNVRLFFTDCPRPSGLTATAPTINGATINWVGSASATDFDLEIRPVGTAFTGTPTITGVSAPFVWTDGAQGTNYQVVVRSNCGGAPSPWSASATFQTHFDNAAASCFNITMPASGCLSSIPLISVSDAPGTTLGTDVFLNRIEIIVSHALTGQMDLYLDSPTGQQIALSTGNGGSGANYGNPATCPAQKTAFSMNATTSITAGTAPFIGSFLPESDFAVFNGTNPNGLWKFTPCDNVAGTAGIFYYAKLFFSTSPLPVELVNFNAEPTENGFARLDWATATEVESDFFSIERAGGDGENFEEIGQKKAAGNSKSPLNYVFWDEKPLIGPNFYRLRQIDFDGKETVSSIRTVDFSHNSTGKMRIFPNPTSGHFFIENLGEEGRAELFDAAGRRVLTAILLDEKITRISTESLPAGLFWVKTETATGVSIQKICIK